uniref:Uncharacterized protein n=1 Tax=Timema cristinae TaxID=61476 RepID=A0A7R9CT71_TIMCR|nr:unnamed protein product [Timema cristinae]
MIVLTLADRGCHVVSTTNLLGESSIVVWIFTHPPQTLPYVGRVTLWIERILDSTMLEYWLAKPKIPGSPPLPRPLALSSASLKPILCDGGREGERCGVASQPTKVSFCANKNRWITETVDGASYWTELRESDNPSLESENTRCDQLVGTCWNLLSCSPSGNIRACY